MGTVRNLGISLLSSKFSRRHAALLASRSSPARRCAREDCDLESTPKRRKTFSSSFRPSLFGLVGRRAVFRFAPITRCETRTKSDAGRAGQRRLERERTRCETLAGTHNAREHAIRRGHDGAIRRFERRMRAHARRASRVASRVVQGGTAPRVPEEGRLPRARRRTPPPGRRARPAVSPARAHDSKSTPRPRRAASATQKRARATRKRAGEPPRVFEKKVQALDARARRARTRASRAEARARRARWKGVVTAGEAYLRRWCGRTHRVLVEVTRCSSSSGGGDCAAVLNVRRPTLERSGQVSVS